MHLPISGKVVSLFALIGVVLAGCSPAANPVPPPSSGASAPVPAATQPPADFKLKYAWQQADASLDYTVSLSAGRYLGVYETLVTVDDSGKIVPELATSWQSINPTTWQFKLADRKFSDGTSVTATDVKWNVDRETDPAQKLATLSSIGAINGATVVDEKTVNVTLSGPDPLVLKRLAGSMWIYPKAYFEKVGAVEFGKKPIGTGMFMVKEFVPFDRTVVVLNPYHPVKPRVTEIAFLSIPDPLARVNGLRSGEVDIVEQVPFGSVDLLKSAGFQILAQPPSTAEGGAFYIDKVGSQLRDKRVRQAINYAVDKETLAKTVFYGYATVQNGQVGIEKSFGYDPTIKAYPYDPTKAKQLLAEAGFASGLKIKADVGPQVPQATETWLYVQSQLKAVGVELEIVQAADRAAWLDKFYNRTPRNDIVNISLGAAPFFDTSTQLTWFRGNWPEPFPYYKNPVFDEPYLASLAELDDTKRLTLQRQAAKVFYDDPPYLFLVHDGYIWAASSKLDGIQFSIAGTGGVKYDTIRRK